MAVCPYCASGTDYKKLGQHWNSNPKCDGPSQSDIEWHKIYGLLLGNATIVPGDYYEAQGIQTNPYIRVHAPNSTFLEWVHSEFKPLTDPNIVEMDKHGGFCSGKGYRLHFRANPIYEEISEDWACENQGIKPPDQFTLTQNSFQYWFYQSGLVTDDNGIEISYSKTNRSEDYWVERLPDWGWYKRDGRDRLRCWGDDTIKKLMHYVGENPPPGQKHRW